MDTLLCKVAKCVAYKSFPNLKKDLKKATCLNNGISKQGYDTNHLFCKE